MIALAERRARDDPGSRRGFATTVGRKAERKRKRKAQREGRRSLLFGLGIFGLVGWSVAVPTVLGTLLGLWLDGRYPGPPS